MANKYERALMMLEMLAMEEAKRHSIIFEKEVKACSDTLASLLPKTTDVNRESFVELYNKYIDHDKLSEIVLNGPATLGTYGLNYDYDSMEVLITNKHDFVNWYKLDHVGRALYTSITKLEDMEKFLKGLQNEMQTYEILKDKLQTYENLKERYEKYANGLHEDYNG